MNRAPMFYITYLSKHLLLNLFNNFRVIYVMFPKIINIINYYNL